jgi:tRNA pseudouridine55 synthase
MHGVIVIDKPSGPTSAEVVRLVKARLGRHSRVGHLGTLDPFATGVLPILVGEGTKLAPFLQEGEKEYTGLVLLGAETDTLDRTGTVTRKAALPALDRARLDAVTARFLGTITQTPPIFSAIKREGVPLYRLARRGVEVDAPAPRQVRITRLELTAASAGTIGFVVACSSGMYVRSLARDLGMALGSAAYLAELRRTRNGGFAVAAATPLATVLDQLEGAEPVYPITLRDALPEMPEVMIDPPLEQRLRNGDARALDGLAPRTNARFKVVARGQLVAIAEATSRVTSTIARIFNELE